MLATNRISSMLALIAIGLIGLSVAPVHAQAQAQAQKPPKAIDNELNRIDGNWRVIEMVENGRAIPEDQMRQWLPGGGVMEIVDYTILFKSPVDGAKTTKTFRLDPTSYPKQIAIMDRDNLTGTGIYKFDSGKLVICITNEANQVPTEFSAPAKSNRILIVMERFEPGISSIPGMNVKLPARKPVQIPTQPKPAPAPVQAASVQIPAQPAPVPVAVPQQPRPQVVIVDSAAGRVLTDAEVRAMAVGTWRINDTEGSIDIVFDAAGTFQTYRYFAAMSNFNKVFVPTPISSGTWIISGGRLLAKVTSSTRFDRLNQSFVPAVRSISATDMILVDHLGRVSRAVRVR